MFLQGLTNSKNPEPNPAYRTILRNLPWPYVALAENINCSEKSRLFYPIGHLTVRYKCYEGSQEGHRARRAKATTFDYDSCAPALTLDKLYKTGLRILLVLLVLFIRYTVQPFFLTSVSHEVISPPPPRTSTLEAEKGSIPNRAESTHALVFSAHGNSSNGPRGTRTKTKVWLLMCWFAGNERPL